MTAERVCNRDADHVESETASVTASVTKPATCEANGETTYTSDAFNNAAFAVQTKTLDDLPALGHDWSAINYTWSEDNTAVTAERVCNRDADHAQSETATASIALATPPTETDKGETAYTALFDNEAFAAQTKTVADIPPLAELKTLRLPTALQAIEDEAFMGDATVQAVIIPDGCERIGERAFANCSALLYVRIPATVVSIADDAFEGCVSVRIERAVQ